MDIQLSLVDREKPGSSDYLRCSEDKLDHQDPGVSVDPADLRAIAIERACEL